jgi:hypothetical protein
VRGSNEGKIVTQVYLHPAAGSNYPSRPPHHSKLVEYVCRHEHLPNVYGRLCQLRPNRVDEAGGLLMTCCWTRELTLQIGGLGMR